MKLQEQDSEFLRYDSKYSRGSNNFFAMDFYGLWGNIDNTINNPNLLCLVLKSDTGAIFTTLRKDNGENREKYMRYVARANRFGITQEPIYGKQFEIIIKEG